MKYALLCLVLLMMSTVHASSVIETLYTSYKAAYLQPDGSIPSNLPGATCQNAGIGCGSQITSEAECRYADVASKIGDREGFERVMNWIITQQEGSKGFLHWKLNSDGSMGNGGGGNAATDADLICIKALDQAQKQGWESNNQTGKSYLDLEVSISNGLSLGFLKNTHLLGDCILESNGKSCSDKVFLGYLDIETMRTILCPLNASWCTAYEENKDLLLGSITNEGTYSAYYANTGIYTWEQADIHPNWVLLHLAEDHQNLSMYQTQRDLFINEGEFCQEFNPITGCKTTNPPLRVYANWLEIARAKNDSGFTNALQEYITKKISTLPYAPLANNDNFGNIVVLQALTIVQNNFTGEIFINQTQNKSFEKKEPILINQEEKSNVSVQAVKQNIELSKWGKIVLAIGILLIGIGFIVNQAK